MQKISKEMKSYGYLEILAILLQYNIAEQNIKERNKGIKNIVIALWGNSRTLENQMISISI